MVDQIMIFLAKYLYLVIILIFAIFFLKATKENKMKIIIFSIFSLPVTLLLAKILGKFFYDPRPFVAHHFTPLIMHAADNGFPSDHSLISFALASVVFIFNRKVGYVLFFLGALVGLSRVYVGVHSPIDIAGSFVISVGVAFVLNTLFKKYNLYLRLLSFVKKNKPF